MKTYIIPIITIAGADLVLLQSSEIGPGATDIGAPSVSNEAKSVWDEIKQLNHKEEQDYEDKVYE